MLMQKARKQPGIRNNDFTSGKSLPHFEELEPRIMLSADSLLNVIGPAFSPDTSMESVLEVIQCSELSQTHEQPTQSETSNADDYQPVLTLFVDDNANEESADEDVSISNVDSAQANCDIAVLLSDSNADQDTPGTTKDGSMPFYINNADLSVEYATSIEIRGPPANETIALPGMHLVEPATDNFDGQVVYLDFDGADDVTYDGPVTVEGIDVPEFAAPGDLAGQEQVIITSILYELDEIFANSGIIFTTQKPENGESYSTIYIGGDDSAFTAYGSFLGLAEQIDVGNQDPCDEAFVFSDNFNGANDNLQVFAQNIANIIAHETGHLLGYEHDNENPNGGVLSSVALDKATNPNPADGSTYPDSWVTLSWTPGDSAVSHDIYIGDNFDDVDSGVANTYVGNQTDTFCVVGFPGFPYPGGLVVGTTYYWRIDEVNLADPSSPWKGDVWSFTIGGMPEIDVELGGTDDIHAHSFGTVEIGQSLSQDFTVRNEGNIDLVVSQASGLVSPFSISPVNDSGSLDDWVIPAGGTQIFALSFTPVSQGYYSDTLILNSNDLNEGSYQIDVTGIGGTLFGDQQVISTQANGAMSVYACDLDGDGDNDVLSAPIWGDKLSWFENLGGGTFGGEQIITTEIDGARSVYACDLDGDGDNDVLSASYYDHKIAWYENLGGTFGSQQVIMSSAFEAWSVFACDLDGDDDNDVISTNCYNGKIAWYENLGGGNFGPQQVINTQPGPTDIYASDLDGDSDNDILAASFNDSNITWYENLGDGTFGNQQVISTQVDIAYSVYACDLDNDGDNDVLSASVNDYKIAWYENLGGGTFDIQQVITTQADGAESVYACDLDGDGDNDVLSASRRDDKIAWYENQGGGIFGSQLVITTQADGARSVYACDLDGDGDNDVLSASSDDDKIAWYENLGLPSGPQILLSEDFDDGDYDGWALVEQGIQGGSMAWSAATGEMVQSSNNHSPIAEGISRFGTYAYWQAGSGWTDYTATVKMKSNDNDGIGVMFRYQDENNYYRFIWDRERSSRALVKCDNGQFTILAEDFVPYVTGKYYQVKIAAQGSSLEVSIDGSPVFSVSDGTFSSGTIALYCWGNAGSYFDDVLVEGPSGANQAPVISSVTASPSTISDAQTSQLQVVAYDPDSGPNPLTYSWSVPTGAGSLDNANIVNPIYTPPDVSGTQTFTLMVDVFDGLATTSQTVDITVTDSIPVNQAPIISSVTANPSTISDTQTSQLQVVAYDPDSGPNPLTYSWSVPTGAGSLDNPNIVNPIYTPPNVSSTQTFTLTVDVFDGLATTSKTLNITVTDAGPGPQVLLSEDFNDGNYNGWTLVEQGIQGGPMAWSAASGVMVQSSNINSPQADGIPKLGTFAYWQAGSGWTDYTSTVMMKSTDNDGIGVMFRYQDENNYYRFVWDKQRNYRALEKCENGQFTALATDSVPYVIGKNYQVKISAQGNSLQVSIDGSPVFSVNESTFSSGTIALYCWGNAGSYFDDITVEGPSGANQAPVISSVTASPSTISDTQTSQLQVVAYDPDSGPNPLTYSWSVPTGAGSLNNPNIVNPIYTPPDVSSTQIFTLTVEVSDGADITSQTVDITVTDSAPGPQILLSEDFNDGDYNGWTLVEQGIQGGSMAWSASSGVMVQSSNNHSPQSLGISKLGTFAYWQAGSGWTDYTATVMMKSTDNDGIGVMFRYQDENNYYRFIWDKERSSRAIVKCENGQFTILAEDFVPYVTGKNYQVKIAVQGNSLQVSIDGSPVLSVNDSTFSSGTIALYCWANAGSHFDDITVEGSSGANQAPVANAGSDQTITDSDGNGSEQITLDGSGSTDSDGTIQSYVWTEGAIQIATGQTPTIALAVGTHNITLTVTDDDGATDTDTVTITINTAPAVYFADPNLKAAVEGQLGVSDPTTADMLALTYLDANNSGITDLMGLEYAVNLTTLYLYNNQISDISPLASLINLEKLRLYFNQISDISALAGLTNLQWLWLGNNQISDISVLANLTNLEVLDLASNQIDDISVLAGLTTLTHLYLDGNQISDISVISNLINLTDLLLQLNQISDVSALSGLINLWRLHLASNQISDISALSGLANLEVLYLNNNQISDISGLAGMINLTNLFLSDNQISDISDLVGLTNLQYLDLARNQISDISPISGLTNFTHLDLTANPLNGYAYNTYIPQILTNNPGMTLLYDADQAVYFADANLKAAVEAQLGVTDPTTADMLGLTYLFATNSGITDLTGLEYGINLTSLNLFYNQISDISPIAGLTNLTDLNLDYNQISDISPVSGLTNLINLEFNDNVISDISPLSGLTNLTGLDLYRNQISDITALAGLTNLIDLHLYGNQVSDISALAGLTNLDRLNLEYNQISDISVLDGLTNLTSLYLAQNQISDISPLSGLTNLDRLDLEHNQIIDISELAGLTNLWHLYLGYNQISNISPLSELTNLAVLNLKENQLSDISVLSGLTNLANLYLISNQLSDISPLSGLTNLTQLWLYENQISDISPLSGLTNLTTLAIHDNQIIDISALAGLINLQGLYLGSNQINDISVLSGLTNLILLGLDYTQISDVDLNILPGLTKLQTLQLGGNQLSDISPLSGMTNLKYLTLDDNQLSDISPLSGLTNLTTLWLYDNQISDISPLSGLTNLMRLYLDGNQVSNISPLSSLTNLVYLSIFDNQISDISPLSGLTNLTDLFLANNQISNISPVSGLTNLTLLWADDNQISDINSLSGLTNLTSLLLHNNQIGDNSPLSGLTNLTTLWLSNNQISDINSLTGLTNLTSLLLSENQINDINSLSSMSNLTELGLTSNQISDISPLSGLTNLTNLRLDNNQVSDISPLSGYMNLTYLDLNFNPLNSDAYNTYIPQILTNNPGITLLYDPAPVVYFADSNLKAAVEAQLSVSDPTTADMLGLVSLSANNSGITDLTGLEYAVNLTTLSLYGNQISEISVLAGLTNLNLLSLDQNQISDISVLAGLTNLTNLYLSYNQISDISVLAGLINLDYLILGHNQISDISPLAGLINLTALHLDYNTISDINVLSGLTNLSTLYIPQNQINDLSPLSVLIGLDYLNLSVNLINDISPLSGLINLTNLSIGKNQIVDISVLAGLINLEYLYLGSNQINDISVLSGLTNLIHLRLDYNQISDVDLNILPGLTNLENLHLDGNQLSDISPLSGMTNLEYLFLNDNQLSDISPLSGLTNLTHLYLGDNQLSDSDISPLTGLTNLVYLELNKNQLGDISPLSGLTNLAVLNLRENQLSDISVLSGLINLIFLYLTSNQISDISPLSGLMNFNTLDLNDNPLNWDAYNIYIPQILANNPGMTLLYYGASSSISGYKFEDINANGADNSEPRLSNWTIELYLDDGDGIFNEITPIDTQVTSSPDGMYSFSNLGAGNYWVREAFQAGWIQTTVDPSLIVIVSGDHITEVDDPGLAFGNQQAELLSEDFNDGNYDGWTLVEQGIQGGPMAWSAASGVMIQSSNINSPQADGIPKLGTFAYWQAGSGWTDYTATVMMKSTDNDGIGVMFRYQDENNYYRFVWDKQRSYRALEKCENGQFTALATDSVPYVAGKNYQVKISAQGNSLQVSIDGSPVFSVNDSTFSSGTIALYCWGNAGSYFDDVLVEGPSGANQAPIISLVTASPSTISDAQTSQLQVVAYDPDSGPNPLTYSWSVPTGAGSLNNANIVNPIYTPPDVSGTQIFTLTVDVFDGLATTSQTVDITVADSAPGPQILLSEDFNDGDYNGWTLVEQGIQGGPMAWSAASGVMVQSSNINSPQADGIPKLGTFAYWQAGSGWTDYTAKVMMKSTDNDGIGVMFRYQDENNYYRFVWDKERSYRALEKCENGQFTTLVTDSVPYVAGKNYQVKIVVQGNSLQISIDGSPVLSANDSTFSSGTIALYCWGNAGSYFDDITVESIP